LEESSLENSYSSFSNSEKEIIREKNKEEIKKFIYVWLSENKKREKLKYVSLSLF